MAFSIRVQDSVELMSLIRLKFNFHFHTFILKLKKYPKKAHFDGESTIFRSRYSGTVINNIK